MKNFITLESIKNLQDCLQEVLILKKQASVSKVKPIGRGKTLGLVFFNPSLRTRFSTQKAAQLLGMSVLNMNVKGDTWSLEFEEGNVMNGSTVEHIKEAAGVLSVYCDIIAVRAFPTLTDKQKDESEWVLESFKKYASVPILNMESATAHPLQGLTDALTIAELSEGQKPRVALSWAPHPKILPQAVPNSFIRAMKKMDADFIISHPPGYELNKEITGNIPIVYNQEEAFKGAHFVYAKNWSTYSPYGTTPKPQKDWMITEKKMDLTQNASFLHCLPVRRNVVVEDAVLDSHRSEIFRQADNRTWAAAWVLRKLLADG